MIELFYLLAGLQILLGLYMVYEGLQWNSYARQRLLTHPGFYAPRAAVICPCKGLEPGLERNLTALTEFDYNNANYEIFFVVAAADDPAASILRRVAEHSKPKAHVVIAGAPQNCAEKVSNLAAAAQQLPEDIEVLVFADSDGQPARQWLARLVAPLADSRVGAATTMRWFMPNRSNLATALLAAWNAPIVTMLGEHSRNFCWGGGTAIRKGVFEEAGVLEEWRNSVSDDYSMTRALQRINRNILFIPECLTLSFSAIDFGGLLEFTNRQILITRVYAPRLWAPAFAVHSLYCATLVLGGMAILDTVMASQAVFGLVLLTILPMLLAGIRGALRVAGVSEMMPTLRTQIVGAAWIWTVLAVLVPFLYVINFVHSLATRKITWRGLRYELVSDMQTNIIPSK